MNFKGFARLSVWVGTEKKQVTKRKKPKVPIISNNADWYNLMSSLDDVIIFPVLLDSDGPKR